MGKLDRWLFVYVLWRVYERLEVWVMRRMRGWWKKFAYMKDYFLFNWRR
jgi:hypothetical protein